MNPFATFGMALFAGLVVGSLVEYWVHRLMHAGILFARSHAGHHANDSAKGVIPEGLDYLISAALVTPLGFLHSTAAGTGFLVGCVAYAFFSAYGHQLQHDNPAACFWMRSMPVHAVHHRDAMNDANFGLALPIWDHVFGTYRRVPWERPPDRGGPLAVRFR
ncbi:MAG: sterol desaturase family protein [Myxococcota bacterium]